MKYYIVNEMGDSIFELPYNLDFCIHCLWLMFNRGLDTSKYRLVSCSHQFLFFIDTLSLFPLSAS